MTKVGRLNPTGSLQFDIVGHESTNMKLKHNKRTGTWNARSLYAGKLKVVMAEATRCKVDIIGLCQHRWAGQGHVLHSRRWGQVFCFQGQLKVDKVV